MVAVATWIQLQIVLMLQMSRIEYSGVSDIRHNSLLFVLDLLLVHSSLQLIFNFGSDVPLMPLLNKTLLCQLKYLIVIIHVYDRSVLCSSVIALSVHGGRVVKLEEVFH